jgi:hypothetical protein
VLLLLLLLLCRVPCRYSGFLVLYPIGVSSELTMAWLALPFIKKTGGCYLCGCGCFGAFCLGLGGQGWAGGGWAAWGAGAGQ